MIKFYEFNETEKRVDIFNERFYPIKVDGKIFWFRNVTTILGIKDKGYHFHRWEKSNGFNSDILAAQAGEFGDIFHSLTAQFDSGDTIKYFDLQNKLNTNTRLFHLFEYSSLFHYLLSSRFSHPLL